MLIVYTGVVVPRSGVADNIIVFTIEAAIVGVAPFWHIPWTVIFVVAKWVTVTDMICARLPVFINAILRRYPVT